MQCPGIRKDMNGDGLVTITDLWLAFVTYYHAPGDWAIARLLDNPRAATFLEISPASCGGMLSLFVSTAAWFGVLLILAFLSVIVERLGRT